MGVTQGKGRGKPRPPQRPSSPRATPGTAPGITTNTKTAVASAPPPPACRNEEEKLRGTSAQSSAKSLPMNITNISTNNNDKTKVHLAATEAKDENKNEEKNDKNEIEDLLSERMAEASLNEDINLNKKLKNLTIKDDQKEEEQNEESDLVSRGPDRTCIRAFSSPGPYVYQQHIVSSDRHGGGTVLYPNISTAHMAISYTQHLHQGFLPANWQSPSENNSSFPIENDLNDYNSEVENYLPFTQELPHFNAEDVNDVLPSTEEYNSVNDINDPIIKELDKIIEQKTDDKDLQPIKRELCEGAMDKHLAPTTPDSAYDSDECSVGSPSSVSSGTSGTSGTSGISDMTTFDRENIVTLGATYTHVATQPINLHSQTGFSHVSNSRVLQTVPVQVLVLPKQAMPPPVVPQLQLQPQQHPQPLAPLSTPPPSPQGLRPILPGINIPSAFNRCSEPAISRIRSAMHEQTKAKAWSYIFALGDSIFTDEDEDGNMFLSRILSDSQKMKSFMEVFYVIIQRLKIDFIKGNVEMASKFLATPNKNGHTPLDIACRFLRSTSENALLVRYLADTMVEEGLAIGEEVDGNGNSLLHRLCLCGDEACYIMAEILSMKDQKGKRMFDVNKKNNEGKTPLHIAAQTHSNRTSCAVLAQLLMRSGADISLKEGCAGNTVFHLVARESCDPNLLLMLLAKTNYNYVRKVINEKNFNEDTPLHMVAANHAISPQHQRLAVQHMIDYGADPKLQNKSRKAPLSLVPAERKQDIKNVLYQKRHVICHE